MQLIKHSSGTMLPLVFQDLSVSSSQWLIGSFFDGIEIEAAPKGYVHCSGLAMCFHPFPQRVLFGDPVARVGSLLVQFWSQLALL